MKGRYHISTLAVEDLAKIWSYTVENWSVEQADRYYRLLMDGIRHVALHFASGRSMGHIKRGYRCFPVESHLIFYRKEKDGAIEVVRILHQSMDVRKRL
jgi:toxin ParE1/3/4